MKIHPFFGGLFSNWYSSKFTASWCCDDEFHDFNCVEQFMMAQKAAWFRDFDSLEKIMGENDPRKQKALGRKVTNFDADEWMIVCRMLVKPGIEAKFEQNADLDLALKETSGRILVEASPYDRIWGVGLGADDKRIEDPKNWGLNFLGFLLTDYRVIRHGS